MTIFGDGEQSRAFTSIEDVAPIIADSPFNPNAVNEIFNIGADTPYSVNHLAQVVNAAMGGPGTIKFLDARNEVLHAFSSHEKLEKVFGNKAKMSLEEGVNRMATWARDVGAKKSQLFGAVEIMKNMPQSWKQELLQLT